MAIDKTTALNAWNNMNATKQKQYWDSLSDTNKNKLKTYWIEYTDNTTTDTVNWLPVSNTKYTRTDNNGRPVTETAYNAHVAAGKDVSSWKKISAPTGTTINKAVNKDVTEWLDGSLSMQTGRVYEWADANKVIEENTAVQLAQNKEKQTNLENVKSKLDEQFGAIESQFSDTQKAALARINAAEAEWLANYKNMTTLNDEFYKTQQSALDAQVGWQQAAIASDLSGKGISQWVINNTIWQAQEAALTKYAALKDNNLNALKTLNDEYITFFKDIESQKKVWSDAEKELLTQKFNYAKELIDEGKKLNEASITATYIPQQAMVTAKTEWATSALKYQAEDSAKNNRYISSDIPNRKIMLLSMLWLTENDIAYWASSRFNIALLDKAVAASDLGTAIQILSGAAAAAANSPSTSASGSPIVKAINKANGVTPSIDAMDAWATALTADTTWTTWATWTTTNPTDKLNKILSLNPIDYAVGSKLNVSNLAVASSKSTYDSALAAYNKNKSWDANTVSYYKSKLDAAKTEYVNAIKEHNTLLQSNAKATAITNVKYYKWLLDKATTDYNTYKKVWNAAKAKEELTKINTYKTKLDSLVASTNI